MWSNDFVVGEDHMLGPRCHRCNWQMGRCGSIVFGSSPWREKTLILNPRCLAEVSSCGKGDNLEEESVVEPLKAV